MKDLFQLAAHFLICLVISGCADVDDNEDQILLHYVAHAPAEELGSVLYAFDEVPPRSQSLLIEMLSPLQSPTRDQYPTIESIESSGPVSLLRVRIPWKDDRIQPVLVIDRNDKRAIIGFVTAFGDLIPYLSDQDQKNIRPLSESWVREQIGE